jgi:signal transduction histidine kinase
MMPAKRQNGQQQKIESIMKNYVSETYFKWNSAIFTSSSLAKRIMKELEEPKTRYRIIHRMVQNVLRKWEKDSYCEHVETKYYSNSRKTKMIIQFNDYGFSQFILKVLPLPV